MAAINKRKVLESAQRNLQKGALDKALKDYQTVISADPRDTGVRLKCGDLLQRMGRNDDAITAYLKVADQFQRDGFDAKAVALYKQVTKIDSKRHDVYVPLADLYQRLGLLSEAMGALQTAADAFHRDGRKREALDLLRRMASLDPANVTSRLKVAELLRQENLTEEAVAEFREAAAECERQGDWEARAGALERVVELHPECVEELEALGGIWLDHAQPRRAHQFAQKLVEADPDRPESQELLARVLAALGQEELAIDAFRACAEAWRVRGEEGKAREIVQRHLPPQDFSSLSASAPGMADAAANGEAHEGLFGAAGELGGEAGAGEGVFGSEPIEVEDGGNIELGGEDAPFDPSTFAPADAGAPEPAPAPSGDASDPGLTPRPEGDVEQLLAEAAVYLRYRKHERAIASLQAALEQAPENLAALEQLGEAHAIAGAPDRAVEAWVRAAHGAAAVGEAARCVVLRGRIAEFDADAAAALELPATERVAADEPVTAEQPVIADEPVPEEMPVEATAGDGVTDGLDEIEIDIDDDVLASEIGEGDDSPPSADATSDGVEDDGAAFELELGDEDEADEPTEAPAAADALASASEVADEGSTEDAPGAEAMLDEGSEASLSTSAEAWELPLDESDDEGEDDASEDPASVAGPAADASAVEQTGEAAASSGELTSGSGRQIQEDFEEAGFYFEQGLFAEAEAIYRRILERAPSHPGALLRLGEIAFQRGEAPESVADPLREESTASASGTAAPLAEPEAVASPVGEEPLDIEPPDALDLTTPNLGDASPHDWDDAIAPASDAEESTANVRAVGDTGSGHDAVASSPVARVPRVAVAAIDEPELTTPDLGHGENAGGASFDLAAELSEAMSDAPSAAGTATDEDGFASLFRDFKRGVSQTLGEGDVETHFDLGIAYREMGLLEDAIGEFRYALGFPSRRLDALQLMGLCALDIGRAQDAVGHLEQALASPDVPADREAPLRYELGRAYHSLPDRGRALEAFRRVYELEPDFQDVADRVAELERADDGAGEASRDPAEAFESFDDLVAGAAETAPAAPVERFESFDDLVAEANDERPAEAVTDAIDAETEAAFVEASVEDDDTASGLEGAVDPEPRAGEPVSEAELESESESASESQSGGDDESEPQPAEPAASAPRRRRKVSFV